MGFGKRINSSTKPCKNITFISSSSSNNRTSSQSNSRGYSGVNNLKGASSLPPKPVRPQNEPPYSQRSSEPSKSKTIVPRAHRLTGGDRGPEGDVRRGYSGGYRGHGGVHVGYGGWYWGGDAYSRSSHGSSNYDNSSSGVPSSYNLRVVRPEPGRSRNPCAICAMSAATGISYAKVWDTAIDNGFEPEEGTSNKQIKETLESLGVNFTRTCYEETPSWSDLPDLAIISVDGRPVDDKPGYHEVVFERRSDGKEYIYDSHKHHPCSTKGYTISGADGSYEFYFAIHR